MFKILVLAGAIASANSFIDSFKTITKTDCKDSEFFCNNFECIPLNKQCDGTRDCSDGSDEHDCEFLTCKKPDFYRCKNLRCISSSFVCDGENDCEDFSDEQNCKDFQNKLKKNSTCPDDLWQCNNKLCIPKDWVCNGENDCLDGSDEVIGCSSNIECDGFKCKNGQCIFQEWRCDGQDDCKDNSDEENCDTTINPQDCTMEKGYFLCSDGKTCVPLSQVCDNITQCPDKSDEGLSCKKSCDHCSHDCIHLPSGPNCICPKGYHTLDEETCKDINECEIYGICDHKCKNTPGSYQCYCDENYSLQNDKKSCKAHSGEAIMYFSSKKEIRAYYLKANVYIPIAKNLKQVVGVDFDGEYVYWTDIFSEHESIVRFLKSDGKKELLVTSGLGAPEDLRIDYVTKNIYFTDAERQHIGVCTNNGARCTILVNKDIHKPRGIVLNPSEGEMYWTDWGQKPQIARAFMDGSHDTPFVSSDIQWPNGLAIDQPNSRLYWTDAKLMTVESIRLDGTDRRLILKDIVKHPYSIAVFEGRLYWSDWATHSIQSCDKFTGKHHLTIIKEEKEYIYGITIYHQNNHKKIKNPCDGAMCSDICLLSGTSYSCACPQDKMMAIDGHTCKEIGKKQKLVLGVENILIEVEHQMLGKHAVEALSVVVKKIGALAYNSVQNLLYVSDLAIKRIIQVNLHTGMAKTLNLGDLERVVAMDYDYLSNNLYWCDAERGTIEVFNFNTDSRTILLHDMNGEVPESITLVPEEGVMFVAFQQPDRHVSHVDRLLMDGTSRTHSIEHGLLGPVSLTFDSTLHRIFIADAGTGNIESTSIDGDDRHGFRSLQTAPIGITSLKQDIFWVNEYSKNIYWADKFNAAEQVYNRKITLDLPHDIEVMHIVSVTPKKIGLSPCQKDNGGCSHLCLQSQNKVVCACPIGLALDENKKTCIQRTECSYDEFFCTKNNVCILNKFRCDGAKNCPNGEDEEDCSKIHCPLNYFQCQDGECIHETLRCDNNFNCRDKSDERNCSHVIRSLCPAKHFRCHTGHCVNERLVCDGIKDCLEGEDEENCATTVCRDKEFRCLSGTCISKDWECDHDFDCPDMSDEHVACPKCDSSTFTCNNGKCVDKSFVCDGENDCGDHSDELSCSEVINSCKENEFSCSLRSLICLPQTARCNGTSECPHNEDEKSCSHECQFDEFSCKNHKCIPAEWVCDHSNDCGDNSDEDKVKCNHTVPQQIEMNLPCQNKYQCRSGKCVDYALVCNGHDDCFDGSDEEGACTTSCNNINNPCSQVCIKTPNGPMCKCEQGFKLQGDGKNCEDIDECEQHPPVCSQICHNIPGHYLCDCYEGFALRSDRKSCKAEGKAISMIFVSDNQIRQMSQAENSLRLIYSENGGPTITGLDASTSGVIYFSSENSGVIVKINQTAEKTEFIENTGQPQKLTLDWLTNNIYYVNNEPMAKSISVCNFEDKSCANLFSVDLHRQVTAIAVDAINKYLFYSLVSWWMFNSPSYVIYKTNLDGTESQELIKSSSGYITGVTFDLYKKEVYFVDQHQGQLSKVNYDGTKRKVILSNITHPHGLNFFENQVYFQSVASTVEKCRLFTSLTCDSFKMKSDMFTILQESRQPPGENLCQNHTCTHLCVATKVYYKCLCEDGKLILAGEECDSVLRDANSNNRRILAVHHHEYQSYNAGPVIAAVVISLCFLAFGALLVYVIKKRNSGTFNVISMRFHNPGYGLHNDDAEKSILQPGEHEYTNPVEFFNNEHDAIKKENKMMVNM